MVVSTSRSSDRLRRIANGCNWPNSAVGSLAFPGNQGPPRPTSVEFTGRTAMDRGLETGRAGSPLYVITNLGDAARSAGTIHCPCRPSAPRTLPRRGVFLVGHQDLQRLAPPRTTGVANVADAGRTRCQAPLTCWQCSRNQRSSPCCAPDQVGISPTAPGARPRLSHAERKS